MEEKKWKILQGLFSGKARKVDSVTVEELKEKGWVRCHYYFDGHVQEVGFRYTALYLAEQLDLTGWVRNLTDGRVEMEVQGSKEEIQALLSRLDGNGRISITSIEEDEQDLKPEKGFHVR